MIEGFLARQGGLHGNAKHLFELPLADVVGQAPGPQAVLPQHRPIPWGPGSEARAGVIAGAERQPIAGQGRRIDEPLLQPGAVRPETRLGGGCVARFGAARAGRAGAGGNDRHGARVPGAP